MLERRVAVGGQMLTLQGLGGVYDDVFLPLYGAHQAQNAAVALAAVEAFFGAGAADGAARRRHSCARRSPPVRSPGRLEAGALGADDPARRRAQPGRHGGDRRGASARRSSFRRLVGVVGVMADKDVDGMLELLEPVVDEIVVTQNVLDARHAGRRPGRASPSRCSAPTG